MAGNNAAIARFNARAHSAHRSFFYVEGFISTHLTAMADTEVCGIQFLFCLLTLQHQDRDMVYTPEGDLFMSRQHVIDAFRQDYGFARMRYNCYILANKRRRGAPPNPAWEKYRHKRNLSPAQVILSTLLCVAYTTSERDQCSHH